MCGAYVSSLICCSLKALLSVHKFIAFSLNYYKRCFVKIHFWLFNIIGGFRAPFQSAFSRKQTTNLSVFSSFSFVDRRSKKTCAPLTAMWWMADSCGFVIVIVLLETSMCKIQNKTQSENLSVFYSATWVIENTIWFSKVKISERTQIEKWRAPFIFYNKKILKICVRIEQSHSYNILNYWSKHLAFKTRYSR